MWGDAQGAATLTDSSTLSPLLLSVTGPAHIPLTDARWSELLLRYDVLVHLDHLHDDSPHDGGNDGPNDGEAARLLGVLGRACQSMARHARTSSNLAALALHAARMLRDLNGAVRDEGGSSSLDVPSQPGGKDAMSGRIALVGRARATCGTLNLLRILSHEVIVTAAGADAVITAEAKPDALVMNGGIDSGGMNSGNNMSEFLREAFTYRSRDAVAPSSSGSIRSASSRFSAGGGGRSGERDAATELLSSVLVFVTTVGGGRRDGSLSHLLQDVPELYDAAVQCLSLLLVLTSSQLYRPMVSSLQRMELAAAAAAVMEPDDDNYFLRRLMEEAGRIQKQQQRQRQRGGERERRGGRRGGGRGGGGGGLEGFHTADEGDDNGSVGGGRVGAGAGAPAAHWSAHSILSSLLNLLISRPPPPHRSISAHHVDLTHLVAQHARGEKLGPDGMYETHAIVLARSPTAEEVKLNKSGSARRLGVGAVTAAPSTAAAGGGGLAVQSGSADPDMVAKADDHHEHPHRSKARVFVDATRGVLHVSSTILLLPFRLMSLALALFGHGSGAHKLLGTGTARHGHGGGGGDPREGGYDQAKMVQLEQALAAMAVATTTDGGGEERGAVGGQQRRRRKRCTKDVLWLTDSPLADLGSALFLILANNCRAYSASRTMDGNPFRTELASLNDNRWGVGGDDSAFGNGGQLLGSPSIDDGMGGDAAAAAAAAMFGTPGSTNGGGGMDEPPASQSSLSPAMAAADAPGTLSVNFENLFASFGRTLHTESGELVLYTLLQSSPIFAASVAVRSDLDTLVVPLLRTLYFSSTMTHQQKSSKGGAGGLGSGEAGTANALQQRQKSHFRSQSQLYVILILLLIFSQDLSFGPDSFRRVTIPSVPWYRERHLRDINLGSVVVLTVLRAVTYNLHRLRDPFLLSNCCAVLLNVSPHVAGLHSYAAMRLASVTVSCMKKYTVLVGKNGGRTEEEGDVASVLGMYGETCRTLLQVVKHSIRARVVGKNLHLIYALVYLQTDFYDIMSARASPFKSPEVGVVMSIISQADRAIQEDGNARTAEQTMAILESSVDKLKAVTKPPAMSVPERRVERANSFDSLASDASNITDAGGDFTYTYEEEADPEIFFVPYVWEVITCVLTASTLEWNKPCIRVFPLIQDDEETDEVAAEVPDELKTYAKDVSDAV